MMEDNTFEIVLKCLFCNSSLQSDSEKKYQSGDMLQCQNCHELNYYDSLKDIATEEAKAVALDYAKNEMEKVLKKAFRK